MNISISNRLQHLPVLHNSRMDQAYKKALGKFREAGIIRLTIGDPDKPPEQRIIDAMIKGVSDKAKYGYVVPAFGSRKLHRSAAAYRKRNYGIELNWQTEVAAVHGARIGTFITMAALTNPGDVALLPALLYPGTRTAAVIAGCVIEYYSCLPGADTMVEIQNAHARAFERYGVKAKLCVFYSIGNPNGTALPEKFFPKVIQFAREEDMALLSDEAYLCSVFPGHKAFSLLQFLGGSEVGVSMYTMSKLANAPSLRSAIVDGNSTIVEAVKRVVGALDYGPPWWIQEAVMAALDQEGDEFPKFSASAYAARHAVVMRVGTKYGIDVWLAHGGMFAVASIPPKWAALGSREVAAVIFEETGVRVNAGVDHGPEGDGILRIALIEGEEVMEKGCEAMFSLLANDPVITELPETAGDFNA